MQLLKKSINWLLLEKLVGVSGRITGRRENPLPNSKCAAFLFLPAPQTPIPPVASNTSDPIADFPPLGYVGDGSGGGGGDCAGVLPPGSGRSHLWDLEAARPAGVAGGAGDAVHSTTRPAGGRGRPLCGTRLAALAVRGAHGLRARLGGDSGPGEGLAGEAHAAGEVVGGSAVDVCSEAEEVGRCGDSD